MLVRDPAKHILSLAPLNSALTAAQMFGTRFGLPGLVEQGRGVPWGGVLTVVTGGLHGLLI